MELLFYSFSCMLMYLLAVVTIAILPQQNVVTGLEFGIIPRAILLIVCTVFAMFNTWSNYKRMKQ